MKGQYIVVNYAIHVRKLLNGITLRPGQNKVDGPAWDEIENHLRIVELMEAGEEQGGIAVYSAAQIFELSLEDLSDVQKVEEFNALSRESAIQFIHRCDDVALLKEFQATVKFPQVAAALTARIAELEKPKRTTRQTKTTRRRPTKPVARVEEEVEEEDEVEEEEE